MLVDVGISVSGPDTRLNMIQASVHVSNLRSSCERRAEQRRTTLNEAQLYVSRSLQPLLVSPEVRGRPSRDPDGNNTDSLTHREPAGFVFLITDDPEGRRALPKVHLSSYNKQ